MKLRHYETFYLLRPDLSDEERTGISEKIQQVITAQNGQVVKVDPWPLQTLAYRVQKQAQGYYVVMEYGAGSETIHEVTRELRLDERVMKFMTTKLKDRFDPEAVAEARQDAETEPSGTEAPEPEAPVESAEAPKEE